MVKSYQERVADLTKVLQPSIDEEQKYYEQLPIGTRAWVPCAGISSLGIEIGHVGRVDTYKGNRQSDRGEWISRQQAEQEKEKGLILSGSSTLCKDCSKILDKTRE